MICNIVLIRFIYWHFAGQYNYPKETGVIPLAVFMVLAPIFSVLVLSRSVQKNVSPDLHENHV